MTNQITEETNPLQQEERTNKVLLPAALILSLDFENNFKMFSYRLIPQEIFLERVNELIDLYQKTVNE